LFTSQHAKFGGSDISLLSVPGHNILSSDYGSFHSNVERVPRPDSRASDCSDVSTDSDGGEFIVTAEHEDGLDALFLTNSSSRRTREKRDFFPFSNNPEVGGSAMRSPHHHQHHQNRSLHRNNSNSSHHSGGLNRSNQSIGLSSESLLGADPNLLDIDSLNLNLSNKMSNQQQIPGSPAHHYRMSSLNNSLSSPHHSHHQLLSSSPSTANSSFLNFSLSHSHSMMMNNPPPPLLNQPVQLSSTLF
jgi:hypothetical protein